MLKPFIKPPLHKFARFFSSDQTQKEVLNRNLQYKVALRAILEGSGISQNILYSDARRNLSVKQKEDYEKMREVLNEKRIPPFSFPITNLIFGGIGAISGLCGKEVNKEVILALHKSFETQIDETLIEFNEKNIEEKEVRQLLCAIRDDGFDICKEIERSKQVKNEKWKKIYYFGKENHDIAATITTTFTKAYFCLINKIL